MEDTTIRFEPKEGYSKSIEVGTCMSPDVRELSKAIIAAKAHFTATGRSGENTHQKYKYAKLEDLYRAVEEGLLKNGVQIWHGRTFYKEREVLISRLIHAETNQMMEDISYLESEKPGNQAKGSAITYMRKAAILCLCAIPVEDDDGEEEEKHIQKKKEESQKPPQKTVRTQKVSSHQIQELERELEGEPELRAKLLNYYGVVSLADLDESYFEKLYNHIKAVKEAKKSMIY